MVVTLYDSSLLRMNMFRRFGQKCSAKFLGLPEDGRGTAGAACIIKRYTGLPNVVLGQLTGQLPETESETYIHRI